MTVYVAVIPDGHMVRRRYKRRRQNRSTNNMDNPDKSFDNIDFSEAADYIRKLVDEQILKDIAMKANTAPSGGSGSVPTKDR